MMQRRLEMVVVTVQDDGRIELPETVRERLGLRPGTQLVLEEGPGDQTLYLRRMSDEWQLVEKDGIWVLCSQHHLLGADDRDWVSDFREERLDSILDTR